MTRRPIFFAIAGVLAIGGSVATAHEEARSGVHAQMASPSGSGKDGVISLVATRESGGIASVCLLAQRSTVHGEPGGSVFESGCAEADEYSLDTVSWTGHVAADIPTTAEFRSGQWLECADTNHGCAIEASVAGTATVDITWSGSGLPSPVLPVEIRRACFGFCYPRLVVSSDAPAPVGVHRDATVRGSVHLTGAGDTYAWGGPCGAHHCRTWIEVI